jgi:hypothetical protein
MRYQQQLIYFHKDAAGCTKGMSTAGDTVETISDCWQGRLRRSVFLTGRCLPGRRSKLAAKIAGLMLKEISLSW